MERGSGPGAVRDVRKQIGEAESVPLDAVMTNEPLAEVARRGPCRSRYRVGTMASAMGR